VVRISSRKKKRIIVEERRDSQRKKSSSGTEEDQVVSRMTTCLTKKGGICGPTVLYVNGSWGEGELEGATYADYGADPRDL